MGTSERTDADVPLEEYKDRNTGILKFSSKEEKEETEFGEREEPGSEIPTSEESAWDVTDAGTPSTPNTTTRRKKLHGGAIGKNPNGEEGTKGNPGPGGCQTPNNNLNLLFAAENLSLCCANLSLANISL